MRDGVVLLVLDGLRGDGEVPVDDVLPVLQRPVLAALDAAALHGARRHHDHQRALLPHHAPEVTERLRQRTYNQLHTKIIYNGSGTVK